MGVSLNCCQGPVQKRGAHLRFGDFHRRLSLHPHLQFVGGCLSLLCRQYQSSSDWCLFNDAYRYMDWLLTVPLLLIEILLVMKLSDEVYSAKAWTLGFGSALMIISGYYGELVVTGDLTPRWMCWFLSMMFFLYIVYELLVGLAAATNNESDLVVKSKIQSAQVMTVISWCTYPVVYLIPMLMPHSAAKAVVGIQIGYCASDIISKCGVGLLIYQITYAKSGKQSLLA